MSIRFGRSILNADGQPCRREWLVTNGLGGYAMGTVSGVRTRPYHGLLIAALDPPIQRYLLLASVDAWVDVYNRRIPLVTHEWSAGVLFPDGYRYAESFRLEGTIPVFQWSVGPLLIEQRIWMAHGENTTYLTWHYQRGNDPIRITLKPLISYRSHHDVTKGGARVAVTTRPTPWKSGIGLEILAPEYLGRKENANLPLPFKVFSTQGVLQTNTDWWWNFYLAEEKARGLNAQEDLFQIGTIETILEPSQTICLICTADNVDPVTWEVALDKERQRQQTLLQNAKIESEWLQQLVLNADQFVVESEKKIFIIGGYPWFNVWERKMMAAVTGLTTWIGRTDIAAKILRSCLDEFDQGMLPNSIDDEGKYNFNAIDATLWLFIALWYYMEECQADLKLLKEFYPTLEDIIKWYRNGTRYQIKQDATDGLLYGGENGIQLTWMDVKIKEWVVTPRTGKAVEVNALWYNALRIMQHFAELLGIAKDIDHYTLSAQNALENFNLKFWCEERGYLYDVIEPHDHTLRPNQLLALSLPYRVLQDHDRSRKVVDICAQKLLIPYGLRTLDETDSHYVGQYTGSIEQRDMAYHQGTAWVWLIGPFITAHLRVYNDPQIALSFLEPFADHLYDHGIGSIAEIFDGNPPYRPRGTTAQAWSVAEVLRVWREIERHSR